MWIVHEFAHTFLQIPKTKPSFRRDNAMKKYREHSKDKTEDMQLAKLADKRNQLDPLRESLLIVLIYSFFGFMWITLTDWLLDLLVTDPDINRNIQTAKGWLFVALTMLVIFFLVKRRIEQIKLYVEAIIDKTMLLNKTTSELNIQRSFITQIIMNSPVMIVLWDHDGNLQEVSPGLANMIDKASFVFSTRAEENNSAQSHNKAKLVDLYRHLLSRNPIENLETEVIAKDGRKRHILWNGGMITTETDNECWYAAFGIDITDKKLAEERLLYTAYNDILTGIPNRTWLEQETERLLQKNTPLALLFIDIDNFKDINDSLGHHVGDDLLKHIARSMSQIIRQPNLLARLGGDEFAIVLKDTTDNEDIVSVIEKIKNRIGYTWSSFNHKFFISLSIGSTLSPTDGNTYQQLSKNADIALHYAKREGKRQTVFFREAIDVDNLYRIDLAKRLQQAITEDQFELFFQPIYRLKDKTAAGFEVLLRWNEPGKGYVSPAEFIPFAEQTGQIFAIETWVVDAALMQKEAWNKRGLETMYLSINISSKTLLSETNFSKIVSLLEEHKSLLDKITFEITETALFDNVDIVVKQITTLKKLGVRIALDDFGTGYSSLTHLRLLPIDIIKLDRSFISQVENKGKDEVIVNSVINMARHLDHQLVAEGIENESQFDYCRDHDCEFGQGYYMMRPQDAKTIESTFIKK